MEKLPMKTKKNVKKNLGIEVKFANRFIVYHPNIPSYLITEARLGFGEIQLTCYCLLDNPVKSFYDTTPVKNIKVEWTSSVGEICDSIEYTECQLVDIEVINSWSNDDPVKVILTYNAQVK